MRRIIGIILLATLLAVLPNNKACSQLKKWEVHEMEFTARESMDNPYAEVPAYENSHMLYVDFKGVAGEAGGRNIRMTGFWDGGKNWKVRFASPWQGIWEYESHSKDRNMDGITGKLIVDAWTVGKLRENPVRRGFVRVRKEGPGADHYFEYSDGTPFLWVGDTWWNWAQKAIPLYRFRKLVDDRAGKGFTLGQLFVPGNGWSEGSRIHNEDFTRIDLDHLHKIDSMVEYTNSKGIVLWIHGWWCRENMQETVSKEKMRRWSKYLVHRYAAYNVIWCLAGEYNMHNYGGLGLDFWKGLGEMIDAEDPYERIIGAHPTPPGWDGGSDAPQWSTGEVLHSEPWLDYNQSQVGHARYRNELIPDIVSREYKRRPSKPIVVTEPWFEFILGNATASDIRFGAWSAMCSGAAGHSYAGGHVWRAHTPENPSGESSWPLDLNFETNTLDYPGARGMEYLARFFRYIDYVKMKPHPELVLDYHPPFCLADPGEDYVIYVRWGGKLVIDLRDAGHNDKFDYYFYNPRSGSIKHMGQLTGGGTRLVNTPNSFPEKPEDWVVYITNTGKRILDF